MSNFAMKSCKYNIKPLETFVFKWYNLNYIKYTKFKNYILIYIKCCKKYFFSI